ncbi:biotin-dependent carboxyltransferase [Helicobacter muridarum]|uniref:Biotin-dependent carboxylase domain-containing protein n=1 Tax=Helicobacter muridarum TaxID=216 RepID=A0A099TXQ1_9HELI|nr:biotin-dependent carboxyltransferase family protein [Helicobacter muridarum]TLD98219.1 biotin-dependent carboxyltransferase [Helicobacter muridarum]STQ87146.1 biotin-dependent carboxylase domain-containing protein [Helicobacter muridarum]
MASIKVIQPGLATYVEDSGRYGYYHLGIPPGGALDQLSFKAGNLLLGNDENAAALEISLMGPILEFSEKSYVVITGAEMTPIVNGDKRSTYSVVEIPAGGKLSFDFLHGGARSYICVKGGIDVPIVMNSRSTYPLGGIGGYKGRKLQANDELLIGGFDSAPEVGRSLSDEFKVSLKPEETLRVIVGLQDYKLTEESLQGLFEDIFVVSSEADRTGYRFKNGRKFKYRNLPQPFGAGSDPSNIADACYPVGSMQAPGGNEPIVLLRDAPSGGGFAMYCTVISCDLDKMGQLPPNHKVRFKSITMEEALQARKLYQARFSTLRESLK